MFAIHNDEIYHGESIPLHIYIAYFFFLFPFPSTILPSPFTVLFPFFTATKSQADMSKMCVIICKTVISISCIVSFSPEISTVQPLLSYSYQYSTLLSTAYSILDFLQSVTPNFLSPSHKPIAKAFESQQQHLASQYHLGCVRVCVYVCVCISKLSISLRRYLKKNNAMRKGLSWLIFSDISVYGFLALLLMGLWQGRYNSGKHVDRRYLFNMAVGKQKKKLREEAAGI